MLAINDIKIPEFWGYHAGGALKLTTSLLNKGPTLTGVVCVISLIFDFQKERSTLSCQTQNVQLVGKS